MNSHTCSLCQVLFWKACCVPKVKQGCSKGNPEQRSRCAIFSGWMGGEKLARICGRRGPLPQGSRKEKESLQRLFGTSTEKLAIDRPSLRLAMVYSFFLFSFCFLFHWLYDVEMLFLSHVSCPVCVSVFMVWVCVHLQGSLSTPARWHHAWGVCVCVSWSVFCFHCDVDALRINRHIME